MIKRSFTKEAGDGGDVQPAFNGTAILVHSIHQRHDDLQHGSHKLPMSAINCLSQIASLVFERESQLLLCDDSPAVSIDSNAGLE